MISAYRLARRDIPGLQLALLGLSQASDDPEALEVLNSVTEYAEGDPDIHLYYSCEGLPTSIDSIVNAFQTASQVVLQKSTREGFGLTVTEAMWKGKPVIGGNVGGIRAQIEDGVSGYLVDTPEQCASRISKLMQGTPIDVADWPRGPGQRASEVPAAPAGFGLPANRRQNPGRGNVHQQPRRRSRVVVYVRGFLVQPGRMKPGQPQGLPLPV